MIECPFVGSLCYRVRMTSSNSMALTRRLLLKRGIIPRIERGDSLDEILHHLIDNIEAQADEMLAAIFFYNPTSKDLWVGTAPNLQPSYMKAVNGFKTGPHLPACGSAVFRGERVICSDVATDPIWEDFKTIALNGNIRAVWSQPIFDTHKNVLGTVAFYFPRPKSPAKDDLIVLEGAADLAALAIQTRRTEFEAACEAKKVLI